jgi:hypothetical protein
MDHKKETPDRSKINMSDPRELKYWCKALRGVGGATWEDGR